jgi:hypothetical protein
MRAQTAHAFLVGALIGGKIHTDTQARTQQFSYRVKCLRMKAELAGQMPANSPVLRIDAGASLRSTYA